MLLSSMGVNDVKLFETFLEEPCLVSLESFVFIVGSIDIVLSMSSLFSVELYSNSFLILYSPPHHPNWVTLCQDNPCYWLRKFFAKKLKELK